MTDQDSWNNIDEACGGTSQETLSPTENNLDDENNLPISFEQQQQLLQQTDGNNEGNLPLSTSNVFTSQMATNSLEAQDQMNTLTFVPSPVVNIDEDTQMFCDNSPNTGESPRDITSPGGGDNSSPFETMESDGLELNDPDCAMFPIGTRRSYEVNCSTHFSTTTPGGSSDEDPYTSAGSTRKRRRCNRTKRDNMYNNNEKHGGVNFSPWGSQLPSPVPSGEAYANETEDSNAPSFFRAKTSMNGITNASDSNLHAIMAEANRRHSNASESSQGMARVGADLHGSLLTAGVDNLSAPQDAQAKNNKKSPTGTRRRPHHRTAQQRKAQANSTQTLLAQYPSSASGYTLSMKTQPEPQHRARYTSEGSRGPVKDLTQQSYPQLELSGYDGETTLLVFVGSESDDKVKPHGFYQACKVTGRNTTVCREIKTDGTQVIHIPFDAKDVISVDCVGILKLRNADVEARIGVTKAKKKSQTVRLVFRVSLDDVPGHSAENPLILQVVSDRINCTQPQGQPEITKKSLDRCPASGGLEMFIIGRNFHKGLKVIFQDPEEADGSHWHETGQVDKDTFNGNHMVVYVPAYHDQTITKPVNVQVVVEHNQRRCEPHSFTYDPVPKAKSPEVEVPPAEKVVKIESGLSSSDTLKALMNGVDPNVFALFAKLLTDPSTRKDLPVSLLSSNSPNQQHPAFPPQQANQPAQQQQPISFSSGLSSSSVEKPTPTPNFGFTQKYVTGTSGVIKPAMFGGKNINNTLNNQNQPSQFSGVVQSGPNVTPNTNPQVAQPCTNAMTNTNVNNLNLLVKSEGQTPFWPEQPQKPPSANSEGSFVPHSTVFVNNNASEIRSSVQLPVQNQVVSSVQSQVNMTDTPFTFQQPAQASTPVQNKSPPAPTDFSVIPTTTWSQHIDMAAPNLNILISSSSASSTSLFNFPIATTAVVNATIQQPWSTGVQITGVNFSPQLQSPIQQPVAIVGQQKFASGIMASQVAPPSGITNQQQHNMQQQQQQHVLFQQQQQQQSLQVVQNNVELQQQGIQQQKIQPIPNQQITQQQSVQLQQQNLFQQTQQVQQNIQLQQNLQGQQQAQNNIQQSVQLQQQNKQQQNGQHLQHQQLQQQQSIPQNIQPQQSNQQPQQIWSPDQQTSTSSPNLFHQSAGIPQQQSFTLSESLQILDANRPPSLVIPTNTQQEQPNFQQILLSPTSESLRPTTGQNSPLVSSETGLTLVFENSFSIGEGVLLTSPTKHDGGQLLQSIISDCSNPTNVSFDTSGERMQRSNTDVPEVVQPVMQLPQELVGNGQTEQFFGQNLQQSDGNNSGVQFQEPNDIEMISLLNQEESQVDVGSKGAAMGSAQNVVDINTYLVNPNSVQPLLHNQQMFVDSTPVNEIPSQLSFVSSNAPMEATTFQQTQPDQQVLGQMPALTQITGIKSDLPTIDHSVLNLGNTNSQEFVNKPEFNEFSPTLSVNEPNNNFFNN